MTYGYPARAAAVALLASLGGCAAMLDNTQGPLQPQETSGPCTVKPFYLLELRSAPAEMNIANTGEACSLLLINPALNQVVNASLLTDAAEHGRATTGVASGGRQVAVTYVPAPGYVGTDRFAITIQPNATGVTFNVTVAPRR